MDNSSRNIVKFIGAITFAALLIMAARFYAESRKEPMPAENEQASESKAPRADMPSEEIAEENEADPENVEGELVEEDAELIMGEPSVNLEMGSTPSYDPQAAGEPSAEQQSAPE